MSQQNGISADAAPEAETEPKGVVVYLKKLWTYRKYLVIEPFFFFYLMASVFNAVAMQNFPLDKVTQPRLDLEDFSIWIVLKTENVSIF